LKLWICTRIVSFQEIAYEETKEKIPSKRQGAGCRTMQRDSSLKTVGSLSHILDVNHQSLAMKYETSPLNFSEYVFRIP
jgi:hypothetical protein